jgi:cyclase
VTQASGDFGAQCVVVAIDSKREGGGHRVYVRAGTQPAGLDTVAWARRAVELGAGEILLTSIDADGTGDGYDCEVTAAVSAAVGVPVIASGGCGSPDHILEVLTRGRADAALAASIFHYGRSTVRDVKERLRAGGLLVR